ncbi:M48 family metallopeptidase [Luteibacter sp. 329MFSha]|uniref:M48 family metallopeptidase n=1 Tax=Luteibacter sp. 329MFSha TaxID=1798239 RepID=UPI0008BA601A|nr:M48 family metallopeptidase [Luteibacter sp. 329MFSha]SEV95123.1 Zn-dependent protease with chaperone function [Luteibacter sp. 329MFSha]
METIYPAGPAEVPAAFTRPGASYRRHAWIAVGSLVLFIAVYLALTAWFVLIGVNELSRIGGGNGVLRFGVGASSLFLAFFMIKGLFFVRKGGSGNNGIELTRAEEPRLFAFLDRIADDAGAPRAHRVFASGRVNAAVFYDLSLLNLLFPSRKNLEIGLALVNMLNMSEFKAVLAHEFGHFAQRSMAVGRWVYTTQQIAAHIVGRRDALDTFLRQLSRFDFRIAWIGWVLGTVIWALRAVVDIAFRLVVVAQRALSREMEMQADLVAVSLTGSDALICALHRLQVADDAWDRAVNFARGEAAAKLPPADLFAVHHAIAERLGRIYNDPAYGTRPVVPVDGAAAFRVFEGELAQPPRMWSTHPMNHEREHNAKRVYLHAPVDDRSAWTVFDDAPGLRERMTRELVGEAESPAESQVTVDRLDSQFEREHLKAHYRGIYLGFPVTRHVTRVDELHAEVPVSRPLQRDELYPSAIGDDLERLRSVDREHALLCSLRDRVYDAPDGVIRHRGRILRRNELPDAIAAVDAERKALRARLEDAMKSVRSLHVSAAGRISAAWRDYLLGVLGILLYAEHAEANLRDAQAGLGQAWRRATVRGAIDEKGARIIMAASNDVWRALYGAYDIAAQVQPGAAILRELDAESWSAALGELGLNAPSRENINDWLRHVDGWVGHVAGTIGALRRAALDELLRAEAVVADATRGVAPPAAPDVVPSAPPAYDTLRVGTERGQRVDKPGFWDRFLGASGFVPALARTVVAVAIVGSVLVFGWMVDRAKITVYNGLARTVVTTIDGHRAEVQPGAHAVVTVRGGGDVQVETHALDGQPIESFTATVDRSAEQVVYNVAQAGMLRAWTAVYGNVAPVPPAIPTPQRWMPTSAEVLFEAPPQRIESKSGGGSRSVLDAASDLTPETYADQVVNKSELATLVLAHVRHDAPDSTYLLDWLALGAELPGFGDAFAARRAQFPMDIVAMRAEQNLAKGAARDAVCAKHRALADASPDAADLSYLATRCLPDGDARDTAFEAGFTRWPASPWYANAAATSFSQHGKYTESLAAYRVALAGSPALRQAIAPEAFRVERLVEPAAAARDGEAFARMSPWIGTMLRLEDTVHVPDGDYRSLVLLAGGRLDDAVTAARGTPIEAHVLRMAAASRGAPAALRERVAKLAPADGLDEQTVWLALADGVSAADPAVAKVLEGVEKGFDTPGAVGKVQRFIAAVRKGAATSAEAELDGVPMQLRARAYLAGLSVLGERAPQAWRTFASRVLFAAERPYLG